MVERKLYKTKLCILYERGRCSRQNCSFAHGNAELRRFADSSHGGRWENRGNDLRDKLDRRLSLERRYSPGRDARGRQTFSGYSPPKSIEKKRDREDKERQKLGAQGDYLGSVKGTNRPEDHAKEARNTISNSQNVLAEQLKEVELDVNLLDRCKLQLGMDIEEKVQEADSLSSRINELETQLDKEKEEYNRTNSKIKKFVKVHNRLSRVQDDLKRSQTRLQKLGDQLVSDTTRTEGNEEDLSINIVSDAETGYHVLSPHSERLNYSSRSKKRLHPDRDTAGESMADEYGEDRDDTVRFKKLSRWSMLPVQSNLGKEITVVNNGHANADEALAKASKLRRGKNVSSGIISAEKLKGSGTGHLLPATSMAAHAIDDVVEIEEKIEVVEMDATGPEGGATYVSKGLPFSIPPPPSLVSINTYLQYGGDDENVDVDGLERQGDVDII